MKSSRISCKYIAYLILSMGFVLFWWTNKSSNVTISILLGTLLIFLSLTLVQITFHIGGMVDLDRKDIKRIWWSRVVPVFILSFAIAYILVQKRGGTIADIAALINTAAFGIVLGYSISRIDEYRKSKEESNLAIRALLLEVSNSRFNCAAILKGHPPTYFGTYVWNSVRVGKYFTLLSKQEDLTNKLFNLYLLCAGANWRINLLNIALSNKLINPNLPAIDQVYTNTNQLLQRFLESELKEKLVEAEIELQALCNSL